MKNSQISKKIGFFDSGLGGLVIAKAVISSMPKYDFLYYGDTKNLPYGSKTQTQIYKLTTEGLKFMFKGGCGVVIIACNTASAKALRKIQQEFLPKYFPDKKVLGVIVPTIEEVIASRSNRVGVICTKSTANSHAYKKEIAKINSKVKVFEQAAPKLVTMIENDTLELVDVPLENYLLKVSKQNIDALILGCTHYPILKNKIQKVIGKNIKVFSQEEVIPKKLALYLKNHREIEKQLSKKSTKQFFVTKLNPNFQKVANRLFGKNIKLIMPT